MNATNTSTDRRTRRFMFGAAAAALFAIPVTALLWSGGAQNAPVAVTSSAAQLRWHEGGQRQYELRMLSDAGLDGPSDGGAARAGRQEIRGRLALRVFAVRDDEVEVGFQLQDVIYVAGGARDSAREQAMATPFVGMFETAGAPVSFRYPDGLEGEVRQQLAEVIRLFQAVVPDHAGPQWTTVEENGSGRYRAAYERRGVLRLHKRKAAFLSGAPLLDGTRVVGTTQTRVLSSSAEFELSSRATWLESAHVEEELEYSSEAGVLARVAIRAHLQAIAEPGDATLARASVAAELLDYRVPAAARVGSTLHELEAGPATAQDIAHFEATLAKFEESAGDDMNLLHELAGLVMRFPELAERVPAVVARADLEDRVASGLIHVLELAGHQDGQSALVTMLDDMNSTRRTQLRAIVALAGVADPTPASVDRLWKLVHGRAGATDAMADTALLSLGRMGMSLRERDAQRYEELTATLLTTLDSAMTAQSNAVALKSIGNTRDAELAPHVTARLGDGRAVVRAAAAKTLGVLESPGAVTDLTARLRTEPDGRVRAVIARSLGAQKQSSAETFDLCNALVETESDPEARGAMARYLVDHLDAYPTARSTLERLVKTETNTETLAYVAGRLYRKR